MSYAELSNHGGLSLFYSLYPHDLGKSHKIYLKRLDTHTGFFLGSFGTILGGAGAIVTGETAARVFSGLSGITSGVRAEFKQSYLSNLGVQVITAGIDTKRKEIRFGIDEKRGELLKN